MVYSKNDIEKNVTIQENVIFFDYWPESKKVTIETENAKFNIYNIIKIVVMQNDKTVYEHCTIPKQTN